MKFSEDAILQAAATIVAVQIAQCGNSEAASVGRLLADAIDTVLATELAIDKELQIQRVPRLQKLAESIRDRLASRSIAASASIASKIAHPGGERSIYRPPAQIRVAASGNASPALMTTAGSRASCLPRLRRRLPLPRRGA